MGNSPNRPRRLLRALLFGGGAVGILVPIAVIAVPMLFRDDLIAALETAAADYVTATVDIGTIELSIFDNFPEVTAHIDGLSIRGADAFDGVTLLDVDTVDVTVGLWEALQGQYIVHSVSAQGWMVDLKVLPDGTANWDIVREQPASGDAEASVLQIDLERLSLTDGTVRYLDQSSEIDARLAGIRLDGAAALRGDLADLTVSLHSDAVNVDYGGIRYLREAPLNGSADVVANLATNQYTLEDNRFTINTLPLVFNGDVTLGEAAIAINLDFRSPATDFRDILSMVPMVYQHNFTDVKATGAFSFSGSVRGEQSENVLPGVTMDLTIQDGSFQYPNLPGAVTGIQVDAHIERAEGPDLDNTILRVSDARGALAGQPFVSTLSVSTPLSDPLINGTVRTQMDLSKVGEVIPLAPGEEYAGFVDADVAANGRYSSIEAGRYQDFQLRGTVTARDLAFDTSYAPLPVNLKQMSVRLAPEILTVEELSATMGSSDATIRGEMEDPMGYLLADQKLRGRFSVNSKAVDLDELAAASAGAAEDAAATSDEETAIVEVPDNIDVTLTTQINRLRYSGIDATDAQGTVKVLDRTATLESFTMRAFQGTLAASGTYSTPENQPPNTDIRLELVEVDITESFAAMEVAQYLMPLAERAEGIITASLDLSAVLDGQMLPIFSSLSGGGALSARRLQINETIILSRLSDALKMPALKNLSLQNVGALKYAFDAGLVKFTPLTIPLDGKSRLTVAGGHGVNKQMAYDLTLDLPPGSLGAQTQELVGGLFERAGLDRSTVKDLPVRILATITGTLDDPRIKLDLGETSRTVVGDVRDAVEAQIGERVGQATDAALEAAREQADSLLAEAQKQANAIKERGYDAADALIAEAKNPIAKKAAEIAANKMREETDKKVNQLMRKARGEADDIIAAAEEKAK